MPKNTILVIDDERELVELITYNLQKEGFLVRSAFDGESVLSIAIAEKPDLIILDLMLPGIDGLDVCRMLRKDSGTSLIPIIMLTAKTSESDRVVGLELGADDYVTKPFSPRELGARVKALLRRSSVFHQQPAIVRRGNLSIDPASHQVCYGDKAVDLTATEFRLLHFLASHPGFVYSRGGLIDEALGKDVTVLERTIDVHIMSLRRKLGECGEWIETIRGFGYKFRESLP
jgi:two-component system, OmpR family, alkaline phosphatase synthesis response regulator PhoP